MSAQSYTDYLYYVGDEVRYGFYLNYSGWKKLVLHPLQTIKDTAYALYHPVETGHILLKQIKQHPIGVAVNLSLSWATGYVISEGLECLIPEAEVSSSVPLVLETQNSTQIAESAVSSTTVVSQAVQISSQAMSGGCCGGICTIGRIGQTTSVITSQPVPSADIRQKPEPLENLHHNKKPSGYLSYFWKTSSEKSCRAHTCATTKSCVEILGPTTNNVIAHSP